MRCVFCERQIDKLDFKNIFIEIYRKNKGLLALMILMFVFSVFVFIYTMAMINPESAVVKIGYGDIGGYRDGAWTNMLAFPVMAVVFGVLHNILAMKIFEKHGDGITKVFVFVSFILLIGLFPN